MTACCALTLLLDGSRRPTRRPPGRPPPEPTRTGLEADTLRRAVVDNLAYSRGATWPSPRRSTGTWRSPTACATACGALGEHCADPCRARGEGRLLPVGRVPDRPATGQQPGQPGHRGERARAMRLLDQDLDALLELEEEPGLGNGGLGAVGGVLSDSMAMSRCRHRLRHPLRVRHLRSEIRDGCQVEVTDKWLQKGNPWEIVRPEVSFYVTFGGHTEARRIRRTLSRALNTREEGEGEWPATRRCSVTASIPATRCGWWKSEAVESFDFQDFNLGDHYGAVQEKVTSETLSKVLYPNDEPEAGKRLRLAQQYFFVSCSLQDMLRLLDLKGEPIARFPQSFAAQLNDTHPSVAVAELDALLMDERLLSWDEAWDITGARWPTPTTRCCPRRSKTWGLPPAQPAAAPARDHLRDQSPLPG